MTTYASEGSSSQSGRLISKISNYDRLIARMM
ncbi:MAG: hypothetical protein RL217_1262 [Pseudomonadota bacterium]|jgi:hypothetical protein